MDRISDVLGSSLIMDNFPEMENPFRTSMLPTMGSSNNASPLPTLVTATNPAVMAANKQIVGGVNQQRQQLIQESSIIDSLIPSR